MAGRIENLQSTRDLPREEVQARGKRGGIRSAQVKKERKLLSQLYADILAKDNDIKGGLDLKGVVAEILDRRDSASVSMLKEIREATEGTKIKTEGGIEIKHSFNPEGV